MHFPAYVPAAVRETIQNYLEGEKDRDIPGYLDLLASAESELSDIRNAIGRGTKRGEIECLPRLNDQMAKAVQHREMLATDVDCWRRLGGDARMQDAYQLLTGAFATDDQWRGFIHSAWAARMDFGPYRERLKSAAELKEKIGDAAALLANLIRQFSELGLDSGPAEFYSVRTLLRGTDNRDRLRNNFEIWRAARGTVLGERPHETDEQLAQASSNEPNKVAPKIVVHFLERGEKPEIDPSEQMRNGIGYAWGVAPPLTALLDTVERAAREFKPSEHGMIGAAIEFRQRNVKTEYLRALAHLLTDEHGFTLTPTIVQAMAIVANVAINERDVDVSYDDVRKTLAKMGGDPLEDSRAK